MQCTQLRRSCPAASCSLRRVRRCIAASSRPIVCAANEKPKAVDAEEAAIEALEQRLRPEAKASRSAPRPMTGIPEPAKKLPPWSERLEGKNVYDAAWEVWSAEEGVLWWANKLAYGSVFVLIGLWIFFRFVGPALGLYTLDAGFQNVPESMLAL